MKQYFEGDCNFELLKQKTIAIIGYGDKGCVHAKRLQKKGVRIIIGLTEEMTEEKEMAIKDGFIVACIEEAVKEGDVITILLPDELQEEIFEGCIKANLGENKVLLFTSGYNVFYNKVVPPENADVIMVVPKCPGNLINCQCKEDDRKHALIAIYQNISGKAKEYALAYASGIGDEKIEIIQTSFAEEAEVTLLCKLAKRNSRAAETDEGVEVMSCSGYLPEVGYFEGIKSMEYASYIIENGGSIFVTYKMKGSDECLKQVIGSDGMMYGGFSEDF